MIKTIDVSHLNSKQIEEISNLIKLFENENQLENSQSKHKNYLSDSEHKSIINNDNLAERIKQRFKNIDNVEIPIIERDQIIEEKQDNLAPITPQKRSTPEHLQGRVKILGDIVNPIVDEEDWQCLK